MDIINNALPLSTTNEHLQQTFSIVLISMYTIDETKGKLVHFLWNENRIIGILHMESEKGKERYILNLLHT